jgi:hypothetical protein
MLSGLAVAAVLTAFVAGVTGAWSPCGFSMVDTIGTALGDARRSSTFIGCATFTLGALIGGAVTFGGLGLVGALIAEHAGGLQEPVGAGLALAAAVADWRGVRIAPQIRRQVPERWRWTMRLPLACGLYGVLLGLGFTTFVLAFAVWALAAVSLCAGSPSLGLLIGVGFGLGRALPVLLMAPTLQTGRGARRLDGMAAEPRLWLGLRRLDALGLGLCALFLGGTAATASVLPAATDPSAVDGQLAWQQIGGSGMLRLASGHTGALPGSYPAIGQSSIAWQGGGLITVADRASMAVKATFPAAPTNALAISDDWLAYRAQPVPGTEELLARSTLEPATWLYVTGPRPAGEIGRPALLGSTVVFTVNTAASNTIATMNLATGARHLLRSSDAGHALSSPSLLDGLLLYERVGRCAQELRIGPQDTPSHDRTVMSLPSTVQRDPGYQPGYQHAYNGASLCHLRGERRGTGMRLGPTALTPSRIYVTEIPPVGAPSILTLPRPRR